MASSVSSRCVLQNGCLGLSKEGKEDLLDHIDRRFKANATEVHQLFSGQHFDFIIFFACLEHLTHDERIIAMKNTWNMLSNDDLWCVTETPNRLWHKSLTITYSAKLLSLVEYIYADLAGISSF